LAPAVLAHAHRSALASLLGTALAPHALGVGFATRGTGQWSVG